MKIKKKTLHNMRFSHPGILQEITYRQTTPFLPSTKTAQTKKKNTKKWKTITDDDIKRWRNIL